MSAPRLPRAVELAHELLGPRIAGGAQVVDATCGNGHDTLFLAQCVGPSGHVYAFDMQDEAVAGTRRRLREGGIEDGRATIYRESHACLGERLKEAGVSGVDAVMFNLGYLPGGDKTRSTVPGSTLLAMQQALQLLAPSGSVTLVIYSGHPGGPEECAVVGDYCRSLAQEDYQVVEYRFLNQRNHPPVLLAIHRLAG